MVQDTPTVLVTGVSGYVAGHIVKKLLHEGVYRVRGTVRNKEIFKEEMSYLESDDYKYPLELVNADLTEEKGWKEAVSGCSFVIHVASPFPLANPEDESELIGPAVSGNQNVFKACVDTPSVKRLVVTSSSMAVYDANTHRSGDTFTSEDWSNVEKQKAYGKSKHVAEKALWKLFDEQSASRGLEVTVINPSMICGPLLRRKFNSSQEVIRILLKKEIPFVPNVNFAIVDVRDVADAHVAALTAPDANGKRYLCSNPLGVPFIDLAKTLSEKYKEKGFNIPTSKAPDFLIRIVSLFKPDMRTHVVPKLGFKFNLDVSPLETDLGIKVRPYKEAVYAMADDMIRFNLLEK